MIYSDEECCNFKLYTDWWLIYVVTWKLNLGKSYSLIACCTELISSRGTHLYLFEQKGRGKWTLWLDLIKDKGIDPNIKRLSEIIVPTMDTARYIYLKLLHKPQYWYTELSLHCIPCNIMYLICPHAYSIVYHATSWHCT